METALHAERDGTIAEVLVHAGSQVDAKDLLIAYAAWAFSRRRSVGWAKRQRAHAPACVQSPWNAWARCRFAHPTGPRASAEAYRYVSARCITVMSFISGIRPS